MTRSTDHTITFHVRAIGCDDADILSGAEQAAEDLRAYIEANAGREGVRVDEATIGVGPHVPPEARRQVQGYAVHVAGLGWFGFAKPYVPDDRFDAAHVYSDVDEARRAITRALGAREHAMPARVVAIDGAARPVWPGLSPVE